MEHRIASGSWSLEEHFTAALLGLIQGFVFCDSSPLFTMIVYLGPLIEGT